MKTALPEMPVRRCGISDLVLPVLGVGCWAFGGGDYWGPQDQSEVDAIVRHAVDGGCNFFDTAESYNAGASETALGAALRGLPRDQVTICTKISPAHTAPATLIAHCEASLRRLQTDYIDLYMVHWPITAHSIRHFSSAPGAVPSVDDAFATLDQLRREGKIRHIGVSNFGPRQLAEAMATGVPIIANELPYSLFTRAVELEMLPLCRSHGVGVLGYMTLLQGVLSDRYSRLADLPEWRRRTRHFDGRHNALARHGLPGCEAETATTLEAIRRIARQVGCSTSDLAIKWAVAGEGIVSSLCGVRDVSTLLANFRAAAEPIAPELFAELRRLTEPLLAALGPSFDYYENPAQDRTG